MLAALAAMISPRFIVGFSGHRTLENPALISEAITHALESLRDKARAVAAEIELFTSIAYGCDTLAVESARNLGIPVHLVLPQPIETDSDTGEPLLDRGFANDFWDIPATGPQKFRRDDWERSWKQIQDARRGIDGGTLRLVRGSQSRPECYYDAGIQMIEACDALIAVWNGKAARGLGGTAEMVSHLRATKPNCTLIIIDVTTGAISTERDNAFASTTDGPIQEMTSINDLLGERHKAPSELTATVLEGLTETANKEAQSFRSDGVSTIMLHGSATAVAALAAILPKHEVWSSKVLMLMAVIEFVLVYQAWWKSRKHQQRRTSERWLRARFGAELVRGLRATSAFMDPLAPQIAHRNPAWSRFAIALGLMAAREIDRSKSWQDHRDEYAKARLDDQLGYFTAKRKLAVRTIHRTQLIADFTTRVAPWCLLFALLHRTWEVIVEQTAAEKVAVSSSFSWATLGSDLLVRFLPIFIPLMAGIASGLRAALDAGRRTSRYGEMADRLTAASAGLAELKTETTARHTILATESVLLDELIEWHLAEKQKGGH